MTINELEVRMRCLEAASKAPMVHKDGPVAGVLEAAAAWAAWVMETKPFTDKELWELM